MLSVFSLRADGGQTRSVTVTGVFRRGRFAKAVL